MNMHFAILFCFLLSANGVVINRKFVPENHPNWKSLPHSDCGTVSSSRIIGGKEVHLNAYPWLVRIGYKASSSKEPSYKCGGVLVDADTVLTAAHCVTNLPEDYVVESIRLGEHNTETNPDCNSNFCAPPVVDVKPRKIFTHASYNESPMKNDIAIIKLTSKVHFTSGVKPICIADSIVNKNNKVGAIVETAGWGIYDISKAEHSKTLQYVKLPIVSNDVCRTKLPRNVNLGPTQTCAGGKIGEDSCNGDSGGPLMRVDNGRIGPQYFLVGIVSFGAKECGTTTMPGVYTNMAHYTEWFLDNLKEQNIQVKQVF